VTRLHDHRSGNRRSIAGTVRDIYVSISVLTCSGTHPASYLGISPGAKWFGSLSDHSSPSDSGVVLSLLRVCMLPGRGA
jgi:hypothetical protein